MKKTIWNEFCKEYKIKELGVELFETNNRYVTIEKYGKGNRKILKRSATMENLVIKEVNRVIDDFNKGTDKYDGLIYMMYKLHKQEVLPLYIGKSEKYGYTENLSANIKNIGKNKGCFCRWGSNYRYHIGSLSACVVKGHDKKHIKSSYERWANTLFEEINVPKPRLKDNIYFWIKAWKKEDVGIWRDYKNTSLSFLENLMIGIASDVFSDTLLNNNGVNR